MTTVTRKFNSVDPAHLLDRERVLEHCKVFHDTILDVVETPWGIVAVCTGKTPASNLSDQENHERARAVSYNIEGYGHSSLEEAVLHLMALSCGAEINEARQFATFAYRLRPW